MDIIFHIEYYVYAGEQVAINIVDAADGVTLHRHLMTTDDNAHWTFDWNADAWTADAADYFFTIEHAGTTLRREWTTIRHRLDLPRRPQTSVRFYCRWIDMPHDTYRYSSAFTECLHPHPVHPVHSPGDRCVRLVCRAPQLRSGHRLVLTGSDRILGEWNPQQGIPMTEHGYNEWVAEIAADLLTDAHLEFKFVIIPDDSSSPIWEECPNRHLTVTPASGLAVYELDQSFYPLSDERVAGTLIPVFSLRSEGSFGVGDFGDLKHMIDYVASTGQKALQVLPINDTTITHTWTDSYPYNCISIYALHPQYIDLRQLPQLADASRRQHYSKLQAELNALPKIDYERVNQAKLAYMEELYKQEGAKTMKTADFKQYFEANKQWLVPYAAFCHYRDLYGTASFGKWPEHRTFDESLRAAMANSRTSEYKKVAYWYYVQYNLDKQMRQAHDYARKRHVILKGDIPIGVSRDGVETWVEPRYFNLNGQAGAPPDAFATDGQNWGFPTYNWDEMLKDGCAWWVKRFTKMSQYFDAYRIDHVLGFFRIWEIPIDAVSGLLGQFSPALGMTREQIEGYGLHFQDYFTEPFITDWSLERTFHDRAGEVKEKYLEHTWGDRYRLKPDYNTQRKIQQAFKGRDSQDDKNLCTALMSLAADVLFVRDRKDPYKFHPRIAVQHAFVYESLYDSDKATFNKLYDDYFYRRNNDFWYREAMKKLPKLVEATRMLVCAEDLGMVPACVPWVINELRILSLEIQSMPKDNHVKFGVLANNPYRSVSTISTHDMPTMRQWWDEDWNVAQKYYNEVLWKQGPAPHPMPGWLAEQVVANHLNCPSMLCLLSFQDWTAIDEDERLADENDERINVPAIPRYYWRYRMHKSIEQLMADNSFNAKVKKLIAQSGRL